MSEQPTDATVVAATTPAEDTASAETKMDNSAVDGGEAAMKRR